MPGGLTRWGSIGLTASSLAVTVLVSAPASADEAAKKVIPDYGAPPPEPPAPALSEAARAVTYPAWIVSEYGLRRPFSWLVVTAEKNQWPTRLYDFFTFGDDHQFGIFPSALFDFGLLPSVGFNAYWKEAFSKKNRVDVHFGTWGPQWVNLSASDTYRFADKETVKLRGQFIRRNDNPFYGMGPRSPQDPRFRYGSAMATAEVEYKKEFVASGSVETATGVRSFGFRRGTCCDDDSLYQAVEDDRMPEPPGFSHGYTAIYNRLSFTIDTRAPKPANGSGVRLRLHAEPTFTLDERAGEGRRSWIKYGADAGVAVDLTGKQRILALSVVAELADPLYGTIPFPDQVNLGGDFLMRGFLRGRMVDRSALVATLQYSWPVWVFLDGILQVAAGNVYGTRFDALDAGVTRLSAGIGVRSNQERNSGFEILVAGGTDPLDEGFHPTSFRLFVGSHYGL